MRARAGRPVPRRRVLASALVLAAVVVGVLIVGEALRHPPSDLPLPEGEMSDPRDEVECLLPVPTEGTGRDDQEVVASPAAEVSSGELYSCPDDWDGRTVQLGGEVVGHLIGRGERRWIQVNDDDYAGDLGQLPAHRGFRGGNSGVGVRISRDQADQIDVIGGASARGDRVLIVGTFHRLHRPTGEMAIVTADRLDVIEAGQPVAQERLVDRQVMAYGLFALALLAVWNHRRVERRRQR